MAFFAAAPHPTVGSAEDRRRTLERHDQSAAARPQARSHEVEQYQPLPGCPRTQERTVFTSVPVVTTPWATAATAIPARSLPHNVTALFDDCAQAGPNRRCAVARQGRRAGSWRAAFPMATELLSATD